MPDSQIYSRVEHPHPRLSFIDKSFQEHQFGTYDNNSSIKTLVTDIISRMKHSILTKNHDSKISESSETGTPEILPPVIQYTSHEDQVEAKLLCSLFPKDHELEKETLIQLWMAEGYLKNEPFEDEGERIFNSLFSEGCISTSKTDTLTGKKKYRINISDVSSTNHTKTGDKKRMFDQISQETLHMAMVGDVINRKDLEELKKFSELRTLLFLCDCSHVKTIPFDLIESLKCLQALDLSGTHITELPSSVGKAMKLRYLDLSGSLIKSLPETIGRLQNLQTLKLKKCVDLFELPKGITKLISLRHLDFDVLGQLTVMPRGIGALSALRNLMAFIVDGKEGCYTNIDELKSLNNLSGSFCISGLEHVEDPEDAKKAALKAKKHLKQLELRWSDIVQDWTHKETEVLAHLEPNQSLQELQILCFPGISLPTWVGHPSFDNLVTITLLKCKNLFLPRLGQLPALKYLEIVELNNVARIDREFFGGIMMDNVAFPRLEKLVIEGMFILETWEGVNNGDFPYLTELSVKFCPNLSTLPMLLYLQPLTYLELSNCALLESLPEGRCLVSLETLLIEDCPLIEKRHSEEGDYWLKIKHVPNVWVDGLEEIVDFIKEDKIGSTEELVQDMLDEGDAHEDIRKIYDSILGKLSV